MGKGDESKKVKGPLIRPSEGFWPTDKVEVPAVRFPFKWIYYVILVVLVGLVFWYFSGTHEVCDDKACFEDHLKECSSAEYIGGANSGVVYKYTISGHEGDWCRVEVKLLQANMNNQDSKALEGKEMYCLIPRGKVIVPESNIKYCHGELREGLQDLVVNKLYAYIVDNLGVINYNLLEVPASALNQSQRSRV